MTDEKKQKLQLEYRCPWVYKIIGPDKDEMQGAVAEIIRDCKYKISPSRSSETAKYHCLNVELTVESESQRTALYEALKAHPAVKMVL
jgi:putative lipoic acid-binding regulatory protein